jgi:hypothetical protein
MMNSMMGGKAGMFGGGFAKGEIGEGVAAGMMKGLGGVAAGMMKGLGGALLSIGKGLWGVLNTVLISPLKAGFSSFMAAFSVTTAILKVLQPVIELIGTVMEYVMLPFQTLALQVFQALLPFLMAVGKHVERFVSVLAPILVKVVEAIAPILETILDVLMPVAEVILDVLGAVLVPILNAIKTFLGWIAGNTAESKQAAGFRLAAGAIGGGIVGALVGPGLGALIGGIAGTFFGMPWLGALIGRVVLPPLIAGAGALIGGIVVPVLGKLYDLIFGSSEGKKKDEVTGQTGREFRGLTPEQSWNSFVKQYTHGEMVGPAAAGVRGIGMAVVPGPMGPREQPGGELDAGAAPATLVEAIFRGIGLLERFVSVAEAGLQEQRMDRQFQGSRGTSSFPENVAGSVAGAAGEGGGGGVPGLMQFIGVLRR